MLSKVNQESDRFEFKIFGRLEHILMSEFKLTSEQLERLQNAFDLFDEDCDNKIDCSFLEPALRAIGFNPRPEEVEDMIADAGNKPISFNAFLYIVSRHSRCVHPEDELIDAFRVFDREKTGYIPVSQIKTILTSINHPFTEDQIDELLEHLDTQKGNVDYKALVNLILTS